MTAPATLRFSIPRLTQGVFLTEKAIQSMVGKETTVKLDGIGGSCPGTILSASYDFHYVTFTVELPDTPARQAMADAIGEA